MTVSNFTELHAHELDQNDPLAHFRDRFHIPLHGGRDSTYLCGNSLGLQPKAVAQYVDEVLDDWRRLGVEGHFAARAPWVNYHELLAEPLARIVGARPHEVVAMNTLTVNLHLMMVSFYRPDEKRYKILTGPHAFPSDRYAVATHVRTRGVPTDAVVEMRPRGSYLDTATVAEYLDREGSHTALLLLEGVNYYTGEFYDLEGIVREAKDRGCMVGLDLAHAIGNVPLSLHEWGVDFAVWCSYKYLNGGPGCTAGSFVHERHANWDGARFAGWWGHDKARRFLMEPTYQPIPGAEGWQLSNPAILPLAALRASLEIFDEAGMTALRKKSIQLTGYLQNHLEHSVNNTVEILTPQEETRRGCQLSLRLPDRGKEIFRAVSDAGVICDWREPDVIRVAPVPLYNSFLDVHRFVTLLKQSIEAA